MVKTINTEEIMEAMWGAYARSIFKSKIAIFKRWRPILRRRESKSILILKLGNGHYLHESDSRPGEFHAVDRDGNQYSCTCESADRGKNKNCRHVKNIRRLEGKDAA